MPGIEFVGDDTGDDVDEDVLDTGPRRPVPRWVWVVAALVVVAVGIGVLVSSRPGGTPDARPSETAPVSAPVSATGSAPASVDTPGPGAQISALTSDGTSLFWVAGTRLYRAGPVGRASASVPISPAGGDFADLQLVPDRAERTIWVVARGASDRTPAAGTVEGFTTADLARVSSSAAPSLIDGATAYNGALVVLAAGRLLRITTSARTFTPLAMVDPDAQGLVAVGDSLLFVQGVRGDAVGRWTPSAGVRPPVALDTTGSSLAVVGSTVVVEGDRRGKDVLDTLKPLAVGGGVDQRGIATGLTGTLQFVATGQKSLVVLGSGRRGLEFACVRVDDSASPPASVQAQATALSANVAVLQGEVFQVAGSDVRPVDFGDNVCPA